MPASESDLSLLIRAAHLAGDIALSYWRRSPKVIEKPDGSPVSEADLAVNEAIHGLISRERPEWGWLSEETPDGDERLSAKQTLILDPIDGTRTFLAGGSGFAHSLALVAGGKVTDAVVFQPSEDRLFSASAGGEALLNGVPMTASQRAGLDGARLLAPQSIFSADHWLGTVPSATRHFRPSLASRLCLVAEGSFDACVSVRSAWEWDIAAGSLIAECAGAKVSDRRGNPIVFNSRGAHADGLIVAGEAVWRAIAKGLA